MSLNPPYPAKNTEQRLLRRKVFFKRGVVAHHMFNEFHLVGRRVSLDVRVDSVGDWICTAEQPI